MKFFLVEQEQTLGNMTGMIWRVIQARDLAHLLEIIKQDRAFTVIKGQI